MPQFSIQYYEGREKRKASLFLEEKSFFLEKEGGSRESFPFERASYELTGDPPTVLRISWQEGGEKRLLLSGERALLQSLAHLPLPSAISEQLHHLDKKQQRNHSRDKNRIASYLGAFIALLLLTYLLISATAPMAARMIPYEWERKLGKFAYDAYLQDKEVLETPAVQKAVTQIVKRIDNHDGKEIDYTFSIVRSEEVNAFAFPGGYLIVTSQLIAKSAHPGEVAGVLAHELTHVIEQHGIRRLVRQAGFGIALGIFFGDSSALAQLMELASNLEHLSYGREQEGEADKGAVKILADSGISPSHLVAFFEKLQKEEPRASNMLSLVRSHPLTEERIKRIAQAPEPEVENPLPLDWQEILHHLP